MRHPPKTLIQWSAGNKTHCLSAANASAIQRAIEGRSAFTYRLNVRPDPVDFRDVYYSASLIELPGFMVPAETPSAVADDMSLYVRHQYGEGSCVGHALANVIDIQNARRRRDGIKAPWRVSARMLYSAARAFDEFPDDNLPGSSLRGALKGFWHRGACDEQIMPYLAGLANDRLSIEVVKDARRVVLGAYLRVRSVLNDYHTAINEAGAILVSSMIHKGWETDAVHRNHGVIKAGKNPIAEGAHAFAIVGYTPEGFLVLNSWGRRWGHFDVSQHLTDTLQKTVDLEEVLKRRSVPMGPLPGVALWRYSDWEQHVLDAWVLRLAAPTRRLAGEVGGYKNPGDPNAFKTVSRSVRESDVVGHIIHLDGRDLVDKGLYASDEIGLRHTAEFLAQDPDKKYDHLLFHAHGGLNTRDQALERARAMIPAFKRNRIYPVFFIWRTGFTDIIGGMLRSAFQKIQERTGDQFPDVTDNLLENALRPVGMPLWNQMKLNAMQAFETETSGGSRALEILLRAVAGRPKDRPLKVHLCGHSAGAVLLGYMVKSMRTNFRFESTTLQAPACSNTFFENTFEATRKRLGRAVVCNLPAKLESSPDPALDPYNKSILWLISRAFENEAETPIAGIDDHWQKSFRIQKVNTSADGKGAIGHARRHGTFDNDPVTMNYVLTRVLGKAKSDSNGGFRFAEIGDEALF